MHRSELEELGELLFALSSVDRMKLLSEMSKGELRLTELSESLDATAQETSKHLARLSGAGLAERAPSGSYRLTSFGRVILQTLPSMKFVSRNRTYFSTHDISFLPSEFVMRLGELADYTFVDHVTNVLTECQHLVGLANQYFLWTIDQPLPWVSPKPIPESLSVRCIVQADISAKGYRLAKDILGIKSEVRFAKEVRIGLAVNEKMGGIVFADLKGRIDFASGFIGYSPEFQKWCHDLFERMWEASSSKWPTELSADTKAEPPRAEKSR